MRERGIEAQRSYRGNQFEGRARRIEAVAGAVKQRTGGFTQREAFLQKIRRGRVDRRENVAVRRVHNDNGAALQMLFGEMRREDLTGLDLKSGRDGEVHIAFAIANALNGGVVRLPAMAQER